MRIEGPTGLPSQPNLQNVKVQDGASLNEISQKFKIPVSVLLNTNELKLLPGQQLTFPRSAPGIGGTSDSIERGGGADIFQNEWGGPTMAAQDSNVFIAPFGSSEAHDKSEEGKPSFAKAGFEAGGSYTTLPGDTLKALVDQFGFSADELASKNTLLLGEQQLGIIIEN